MIGREAFDSPEEHLADLTGMTKAQASKYLKAFDNDPNEAAEAYFQQLDQDVNATEPQLSNEDNEDHEDNEDNEDNNTSSVDRLLQSTPPTKNNESATSHSSSNISLRNPVHQIGGRRLSSAPNSSNGATRIRTLHVAFFQQTVVFFEVPQTRPPKPRRRGVHTSSSFTGPYDNRPDISRWIGENEEVGRISQTDQLYENVLADMNNNKVPNLPWLRNDNNNNVQFSFVLHDLRKQGAPPVLASSSSSGNTTTFRGTGNTLGGGGGSGGTRNRTPTRHIHASTAGKDQKKPSMHDARIIFGVVLGCAVCLPLFCSYALHCDVHLGYSIVGGMVGWLGVKGWETVSQPAVVQLQYVHLDAHKLKTTLKFSWGRETWTKEYNHEHTVQQLHMSVVECLFGRDSAEYRGFYERVVDHSSRNGNGNGNGQDEEKEKVELIVRMRTGFGNQKRVLDPCGVSGGKTLQEEKLIMERIDVILPWENHHEPKTKTTIVTRINGLKVDKNKNKKKN